MKPFFSHMRLMLLLWATGVGATLCSAMDASQLKALLDKPGAPTVIDVRSTALYAKGHIPGAINIPASICPEKQLPPLGKVVVCGSGLGEDGAAAATAALAAKKGITVEILEGGFAAWETAQGSTTHEPGLKPETLPLLTYDQLKKAPVEDLVLVDLRKPAPQVRQGTADSAAAAPKALTDLSKEFPGAAVTRSPFQLPQTRQAAGKARPMLVLIDSGDGSAQRMARLLKANGQHRFVILAGGEEILARSGRPGLQRQGPASGLQNVNP